MEIKAKFEINDLTKAKYDTAHKGQTILLEIMFINTETCSAGTQIFYTCRVIVIMKEFKHSYSKEGAYTWEVAHGINNKQDNATGYQKYREDELIPATSDLLDIVHGVVIKGNDDENESSK